jgi:hypothetical protein
MIQEDLFAMDLPEAKGEVQEQHLRLYAHLRDDEDCAEDRAFVNAQWRVFRELGLGDPDLVERFPLECGSRIWEIQVATTLASWGWKVVPPRALGAGPDFGISLPDGGTAWVEATAATAGSEEVGGIPNRDKVRAPPGRVLRGHEIDRTIMLRYLGAIDEKRKQYARWAAKGVIDGRDGFVIALSGAMVPEAIFELSAKPPRIVSALFGIGDLVVSVPVDDASVGTIGFDGRDAVLKQNGSSVSARLFADALAPELSAVLFSRHYLKQRPELQGRPPGYGYVLALNPGARVKFPLTPPTGYVFDGARMVDLRDP